MNGYLHLIALGVLFSLYSDPKLFGTEGPVSRRYLFHGWGQEREGSTGKNTVMGVAVNTDEVACLLTLTSSCANLFLIGYGPVPVTAGI